MPVGLQEGRRYFSGTAAILLRCEVCAGGPGAMLCDARIYIVVQDGEPAGDSEEQLRFPI
jgi:hypothetical protein